MLAGEAPGPATGRCTPSLIIVISSSCHRLYLVRPAPPVVFIGAVALGLPDARRIIERSSVRAIAKDQRRAERGCRLSWMMEDKPADRSPWKAMSKALRTGFVPMVRRRRPWPVGSRLITAR